MNKALITTMIVSVAGVGSASAQAYVYPAPVPPPAAYPAPPPPAYLYVLPLEAGPYVNFDAGPTLYQNGELKNFGGPGGGPVSSSVHYRAGGSGDVSFGYAFNRYVAAGLEFGINATTIDTISGFTLSDAEFYNIPFLANVTFSYPIPHSLVTPYIGGGAGGSDSVFDPSNMSQNDLADNNPYKSISGREDDVVFAWEAYAGLRFQLNPYMTLGIGYKYFGTGNPSFGYPPAPDLNVGFRGVETHSILATFNWRF